MFCSLAARRQLHGPGHYIHRHQRQPHPERKALRKQPGAWRTMRGNVRHSRAVPWNIAPAGGCPVSPSQRAMIRCLAVLVKATRVRMPPACRSPARPGVPNPRRPPRRGRTWRGEDRARVHRGLARRGRLPCVRRSRPTSARLGCHARFPSPPRSCMSSSMVPKLL